MSEEEFRDTLLGMVLSVTEVSVLWGKDKKTVMMNIYKGRLVARQAAFGSVWFILRSSARKLWGEPRKENFNEGLDD